MKKAIGVIGLGMVGNQVSDWFKSKKFPVFGYDKYKNIGSLEAINQTQIIFLCLPTPYNPKTGSDISTLIETVKFFKTPKVFVIKSTVLPGTTDSFAKKFSQHQFLFNPEFLREKYARVDFRQPTLQLVGYTSATKNIASNILNLLPKAKYSKVLASTSAELVKYAVNAFLATKVTFANQLYDLCQKRKINYEEVQRCLQNEPRIGGGHLQIFHSGYRGFGGKCLPKDLKAFVRFFRRNKAGGNLFQTVDLINSRLLRQQKFGKILEKYWLKNRSL